MHNIIDTVMLLHYCINMRHKTANVSYKHNDGNATDVEKHVPVNKQYH
jgi:hypothetical protein